MVLPWMWPTRFGLWFEWAVQGLSMGVGRGCCHVELQRASGTALQDVLGQLLFQGIAASSSA